MEPTPLSRLKIGTRSAFMGHFESGYTLQSRGAAHARSVGLPPPQEGRVLVSNFITTIPMDEIAKFCQRWKIRELALFGSALRDDFGPDSDLDILEFC